MPVSSVIDSGIFRKASLVHAASEPWSARRVVPVIIAAIALSAGCSSVGDSAAKTRFSAEPGDAVAYYESGAYGRDVDEIITRAKAWIDWRAGQPRQAGERLVLVLDVDDTALSNFPGLRELGAAWSDGKARDAWRRRAVAPAIAPVLELFHFTLARNVEVIFISERIDSDLREATEKNLREAGFAGYTKLVMRAPQYALLDTRVWKDDARREVVFEGTKIIAAMGDQAEDTEGPFNERVFRLPALSSKTLK